jgi:hypothetical protein
MAVQYIPAGRHGRWGFRTGHLFRPEMDRWRSRRTTRLLRLLKVLTRGRRGSRKRRSSSGDWSALGGDGAAWDGRGYGRQTMTRSGSNVPLWRRPSDVRFRCLSPGSRHSASGPIRSPYRPLGRSALGASRTSRDGGGDWPSTAIVEVGGAQGRLAGLKIDILKTPGTPRKLRRFGAPARE